MKIWKHFRNCCNTKSKTRRTDLAPKMQSFMAANKDMTDYKVEGDTVLMVCGMSVMVQGHVIYVTFLVSIIINIFLFFFAGKAI